MPVDYVHRSTGATEHGMLHVVTFKTLLKVVCKTNVSNRNQNSPLVFMRISKLMLPLRKYSSSKTIRNTIQ